VNAITSLPYYLIYSQERCIKEDFIITPIYTEQKTELQRGSMSWQNFFSFKYLRKVYSAACITNYWWSLSWWAELTISFRLYSNSSFSNLSRFLSLKFCSSNSPSMNLGQATAKLPKNLLKLQISQTFWVQMRAGGLVRSNIPYLTSPPDDYQVWELSYYRKCSLNYCYQTLNSKFIYFSHHETCLCGGI
jgi:hypothetical protein